MPSSHAQPVSRRYREHACKIINQRGVTLVEVMIAVVVFAVAASGISLLLLRSYQLTSAARYLDEARAVLVSYTDQFERLQVSDNVDISGVPMTITRHLFLPTANETGGGLRPIDLLSNEKSNNLPQTTGSSLAIVLGGTQNPINAFVSRIVEPVDPTGATGPNVRYPAGSMLMGTFIIKYRLGTRDYRQSFSILRTAD